MKSRVLIVLLLAIYLPLCYVAPFLGQSPDSFAAEDSNGNGHPADSLVVKVGYAGDPAETLTVRKTYTPQSLMSAGAQVREYYSWIDRMPAPCFNPARGVRLTDILTDSGIDPGSAERIHFTCNDAHETKDLTVPYLFDVTKYYYPNLFSYWDFTAQKAGVGADGDRELRETIITVEDQWQRVTSVDDVLISFDEMITFNRFRLVFGMTDTEKQTAYNSAKWIESIEVTLAGAPPKDETDEENEGDKGENNNGNDKDKGEADDQSDKLVGSEKGTKPDKDTDKSATENPAKKENEQSEGKNKTGTQAKTAKKENEQAEDKSKTETQANTAKKAMLELPDTLSKSGNGSAVLLKGNKMRELTIDASELEQNDAAYQPWRLHDMADEAEALRAAGLVSGLEGPIGFAMGGAVSLGALIYIFAFLKGLL